MELCDFCLSESSAEQHPYIHLTTTFFLPSEDGLAAYCDVDGQWATCRSCHPLILAGDRPAIEAALVEPAATKYLKPYAWAYRRNRQRMLEAFWANYTGTWVPSDVERGEALQEMVSALVDGDFARLDAAERRLN